MITSIINMFRRQAQEHKSIKAFCYNRTYELGSGKDQYPLFWLEDPIYGQNRNNIFTNSVSFSVLFASNNDERGVLELQSLAFSVGLNIIERIKQDRESGIDIRPDWTYTTLRNYYDDNACGCRFSVNFGQVNMQNLCLINEQFDTSREFATTDGGLHTFDITTKGKTEIFAGKLPQFDIKTKK